MPRLAAPGAPPFQVWTRIDMPDPALGIFGGGTPSGLVLSGVLATPDGLLAVGRRWDVAAEHPMPQAWLADR